MYHPGVSNSPSSPAKHCWALTILHSVIGGALMSFLPTTNRSGILAGIYLVNAVVAPLTIFYGVSLIGISVL